MIPTLDYTDPAGKQFRLRGIRLRDQLILAEILRDRPDDGTGRYGVAHSQEHCEFWSHWNETFEPLPGPYDPTNLLGTKIQVLSWMLDVDGETVGMVQARILFFDSVIHYCAIHPAQRGRHYSTVALLMLRPLLEAPPVGLGVETVSFEVLASSPQMQDHAANRLGLTEVETVTGLTGQQVKRYRVAGAVLRARVADTPDEAAIVTATSVT